jgi:hypothetical protein
MCIFRLFDREHVPLGLYEHCPGKLAYFWHRFGFRSTCSRDSASWVVQQVTTRGEPQQSHLYWVSKDGVT